jgi:hypothetical protein
LKGCGCRTDGCIGDERKILQVVCAKIRVTQIVGGHTRDEIQIDTQYALDFYANTECDASLHGEGEYYLGSGSASVTTDSNGNAGFEFTVPAASQGSYLTVTATDPFGNTSEFSPCRPRPLRLEFIDLFGGPELVLKNVGGSPIPAARLPHLRILAATNLSPPVTWVQLSNSLELINGFARVQGLEPTNGLQFYRAVESQ